MTRTLIVATHNAGKLREIQAYLAPLQIQVLGASDLAVPSPAEPYRSFLENALLKARTVARATGQAALADDSGLCVPALAGAPSVDSAYYAAMHGAGEGDAANLHYLLKRLDGVEDRQAYFCCTMVYVRHADDPDPLVAQGRWAGTVLTSPRGTQGFGYDPIFWDPRAQLSAAEMSPEQKNQVSHRGLALQALVQTLRTQGVVASADTAS